MYSICDFRSHLVDLLQTSERCDLSRTSFLASILSVNV